MGLLLLVSHVCQLGLDNIPPVTLGVLGLNVCLFLSPAAGLHQVTPFDSSLETNQRNYSFNSFVFISATFRRA